MSVNVHVTASIGLECLSDINTLGSICSIAKSTIGYIIEKENKNKALESLYTEKQYSEMLDLIEKIMLILT